MKIRHKRTGDEKEVRDIADMPAPPQWAIGYIHGPRDEYIFYHGLDWEEVKPEPVWENVTDECEWEHGVLTYRGNPLSTHAGMRLRKVRLADCAMHHGERYEYKDYFIIERRQS